MLCRLYVYQVTGNRRQCKIAANPSVVEDSATPGTVYLPVTHTGLRDLSALLPVKQ